MCTHNGILLNYKKAWKAVTCSTMDAAWSPPHLESKTVDLSWVRWCVLTTLAPPEAEADRIQVWGQPGKHSENCVKKNSSYHSWEWLPEARESRGPKGWGKVGAKLQLGVRGAGVLTLNRMTAELNCFRLVQQSYHERKINDSGHSHVQPDLNITQCVHTLRP